MVEVAVHVIAAAVTEAKPVLHRGAPASTVKPQGHSSTVRNLISCSLRNAAIKVHAVVSTCSGTWFSAPCFQLTWERQRRGYMAQEYVRSSIRP